jgi:hypothetical protein
MADTTTQPMWPELEVARLRVDTEIVWSPEDHFCPCCGCTKSGWADEPNVVAEWCDDPDCLCHEDDAPASP